MCCPSLITNPGTTRRCNDVVCHLVCNQQGKFTSSQTMLQVNDNRKIGIGLTLFGALFLFLGVLLLFDKALLALGNVRANLLSFRLIISVSLPVRDCALDRLPENSGVFLQKRQDQRNSMFPRRNDSSTCRLDCCGNDH
jgi:hypothetical protein